MKQLVVLVGCAVLLSVVGGCQSTAGNKSGVEVIIEGDGEFPEFLVGRWKADKDGWEFVFEPDGTISSVVVSLGRVRVKPGEVTTVPMKMGGKGIYEPGEWMVYYAPVGRELMVRISLKNLYVEMGENVLEGKSMDIFAGPVLQDDKVWPVEWTSFPDYVAHTAEYPDFPISEDPNYGISKTLVFEKVAEE
ncbi:MAG TPA: hypothetical protein VMY06_11530 [Sedimentisphaerales bacterium]|nr:hypothetical protein [Sedimentisphaerales bacterium]